MADKEIKIEIVEGFAKVWVGGHVALYGNITYLDIINYLETQERLEEKLPIIEDSKCD